MGDDGHRRSAGTILLRSEPAAQLRVEAEHREIRRGRELDLDELGVPRVGQECPAPLGHHRTDAAEQVGELRDVHVRRVRIRLGSAVIRVLVDVDQLAGPRKRPIAQREGVYGAEDGRAAADPKRQNGERGGGKAGRRGKAPACVPDIEHQAIRHGQSPSRFLAHDSGAVAVECIPPFGGGGQAQVAGC